MTDSPGPSSRLTFTENLLASGTLRSGPMTLLDVGARGGAASHWEVYRDQLHLIGFEPDAEECARLNLPGSRPCGRRETYYPVALYRTQGTRTLYLTKNGHASSLLQANLGFVSRFPQAGPGTVIGTAEVRTTDLDSFAEKHALPSVDFVKLDVEGAELAVLEGADRLLQSGSVLGLYVEVFFQPYHIDRPLFGDVDQYLRKRGFALFDLDPERWVRKTLSTDDPKDWYGAGQLIWANALYFRDPVVEMASPDYKAAPDSRIRILKLASLAEVFGLRDFAIEVIQAAAERMILSGQECREMSRSLAGPPREWKKGGGLVRRLARVLLPASIRRKIAWKLKQILFTAGGSS